VFRSGIAYRRAAGHTPVTRQIRSTAVAERDDKRKQDRGSDPRPAAGPHRVLRSASPKRHSTHALVHGSAIHEQYSALNPAALGKSFFVSDRKNAPVGRRSHVAPTPSPRPVTTEGSVSHKLR